MALFERLKNTARKVLASSISAASSLDALLQLELSRELARLQAEVRIDHARQSGGLRLQGLFAGRRGRHCRGDRPPCRYRSRHFIEIGCGDGRENNSHYLLLKGWRGIWVDGDPENIAAIRNVLPLDGQLRLVEQMVTRDNVTTIPAAAGSPDFGPSDLLSVDVDGNDLAIAKAAISAWSPKIIIGEYNAKFPYPMQQEVSYDPQHRWARDDYHGASLAAWVEGLYPAYQLVSCNLAGTNAFFVRDDLAGRLTTYAPAQLYQPPGST